MEHRAKEENIPAWFMRQWIKTHEATRVEVMKCSERLCREMKRDRSCTEVRTSFLQEVALWNRVFRNAFGQQFSCVAVGLGWERSSKGCNMQVNKKKTQSHFMKQQCQIILASNSFPGFGSGGFSVQNLDLDGGIRIWPWPHWDDKSRVAHPQSAAFTGTSGWKLKKKCLCASRLPRVRFAPVICQNNEIILIVSNYRLFHGFDKQATGKTSLTRQLKIVLAQLFPPLPGGELFSQTYFRSREKNSNFCLHTQAKLGATLWKWRSLSFLGYIKLKTAQPARIRECAAQRLTCLFVHFLHKTTKTAPMITFIPTGWQIKLGYSCPSFGFSSRCLLQALEQKI